MNDERFRDLLQAALPPIGDSREPRDLWPQMRGRLEAGDRPIFRFGPLDWAIAAALAASIFIFPRLIPALLYQL